MSEKGLLKQNQQNTAVSPSFGAAGIDAINKNILQIYPDQKNHLQANAMTKYWNGGPDPLDYVSMLLNRGNAARHEPEHWHYVSFGLSDLHGDGRVHDVTGPDEDSGYGFELTFRLRRQPGEQKPPMWPANLMNALARYVFQTGNGINVGDNIPWHASLDDVKNTAIRHMLVTRDPQLGDCQTQFGHFEFRQIVGICDQELKAAQQWKGNGLLELIRQIPTAGGPLYVTDIARQQTVFELKPKCKRIVHKYVEKYGSNLGHVMAISSWEEDPQFESSRGTEDEDMKDLNGVILKFDLEAASLLPLIMRSRLQKNKYFIYQNLAGQVVVLMPADFESDMVIVDAQHPIRSEGEALQIYCSNELVSAMATDLSLLENTDYLQDKLPIKFEINSPPVTIMVLPEEEINHRS